MAEPGARADFDPLGALRALHRHGVRFVVIGGVASVAHGSPSVTKDLDICYERTTDNMERLATALREINARLRGAPPDVPFLLDAKTIERGDAFTFSTDMGPLDCLGTPSGVRGYEGLLANSADVDFGGLTLPVAGIDDLMDMKRAAGRPQDLKELEILGALRDELERRGEL